MSELKLILIDQQDFAEVKGLYSPDTGVAALASEPENISEFEAALQRFHSTTISFTLSQVNQNAFTQFFEPVDPHLFVVDLTARIVACEPIYRPRRSGSVICNGRNDSGSDLYVDYCLPDDWLFLESLSLYLQVYEERRQARVANPPLDIRNVLYGRPLLEFIAKEVRRISRLIDYFEVSNGDDGAYLMEAINDVHARWLLTPCPQLRNQSPRQVIVAKLDLISRDLASRAKQWSQQRYPPPGISRESFAYRFGGFGKHEWVLYHDLVRFLVCTGFFECESMLESAEDSMHKSAPTNLAQLIQRLEETKTKWLMEPCYDLEGDIPFTFIDNERQRLPEALSRRCMVADEDCPVCMLALDQLDDGHEVWFIDLDSNHMSPEFAFSPFPTIEEWEAEQLREHAAQQEFERKWRAAPASVSGEDTAV